MFRLLIALLLPCVLTLTSTAAQTLPRLTAGERIRVSYRCQVYRSQVSRCNAWLQSRRDIGQVQALDRDSIRFRAEATNAVLAVPIDAVEKLSVFQDRRGHFWTGAGLGLVVGAFIGAAIGSTQEFCIFTCGPATEIGFILGVPVGFVTGGILGAIITSDRWVTVPIGRVEMDVAIRGGRIGVRVPVSI